MIRNSTSEGCLTAQAERLNRDMGSHSIHARGPLLDNADGFPLVEQLRSERAHAFAWAQVAGDQHIVLTEFNYVDRHAAQMLLVGRDDPDRAATVIVYGAERQPHDRARRIAHQP